MYLLDRRRKINIHNNLECGGSMLNGNFRSLILIGFLLIFIGSVFAATPTIKDVNVSNATGINQDSEYTNNATVYIRAEDDGNANFISLVCDGSSSWTTPEAFSSSNEYDFDVTNTGTGCNSNDGSKAINVKLCEAVSPDRNCATTSGSITYDVTSPTTTSDNPSGWQNTDSGFSVTLSCSDTTSDCNKTNYRFDTDASNAISYGSWEIYSSAIPVSTDGNWAIDFNSMDNAGNSESPKTIYALLDTTKPTITINNPTEDENYSSRTINFDVNRIKDSEINLDSIIVYVNGLISTSFDADDCTDDGNAHCSYDEFGLTKGGEDYNLAVYAEDDAGNWQQADRNFHFTDTTAPGQAATPAFTSRATQSISFNWTKHSEQDVNAYYIYRDTNYGFTVDGSKRVGIAQASSICVGSSCSYTDTNGLVNDTNYFYRIAAVDYTGNEGTASVSSETQGGPWYANPGSTPSSGPTVTSSSHANTSTWYSADDVSLSFTITGAGSGTEYSYVFDSSSGTTPDETAEYTGTTGTASYNDQSDGEYYFHVKASTDGSTWSDVTHFRVRIDDTAPGNVSNFSGSSDSDGDVTLTWTAPSDTSGIAKYYIYRSTSDNFSASSSNRITDNATGTSYTDDDQDTDTYYYRIKAIDNAGNEGSVSDDISVSVTRGSTACDYIISVDTPNYAKTGTYTVNVSSTSQMINGKFEFKVEGNSYSTLKSGQNNSSFSQDITFVSGDDGRASVRVIADDDDGDECSITKNIVVDTITPTLSFENPLNNATITADSVELKASATDYGTGMKEVDFYYDSTKIITVTSSLGTTDFIFNWDVTGMNTGSYTLKAVAEDNAGNIREETISVTIQRETQEETAANNAISTAETNKGDVESLFKFFEDRSFTIPAAELNLKSEADALLDSAKTLRNTDDFNSAEAKADEANAKYNQIKNAISSSVTETVQYSYNANELEAMLSLLINDQNKLDEAIALLQDNTVERALKIYEVKNGTTGYSPVIEITYTNNSGETQDLQLVEIVPKEFALKASLITSNYTFSVLQEDPIVVFDVNGVAPNQQVVINYGLKHSLTEDAADSLVTVVGKFKSPPIPFDAGTEISVQDVTPQSQDYSALLTTIIVVLVILILVIIVGGGLYYYNQIKEPGRERGFSSDREDSEGFGGKFAYKGEKKIKFSSGKKSEKKDSYEGPGLEAFK